MAAPTVLHGMREPRSTRIEEMAKASAAAASLPFSVAHDPSITVYVSSTRGYLCEVVNQPAYVDQGRRYPAKRIAAQFQDGVYRNDARDPKLRALIDEALQANKYFGKFGGGSNVHFWLASDQNAQMAEAKREASIRTLKSLPKEMLEAALSELKQGDEADHAVPPAEVKTQRTTRPIPAE